MDLVFARIEFLRLIGAQNKSLRFIIIYYMLKYTFGITTTLLESLRSKKNPIKGSIQAILVIRTQFFAREDFLRLDGAQNKSIRLIIIYYIFKYTFGIKTTLLVSFRSKKKKKLITKLDLGKTSYKDLVFARGAFFKGFLSSK